VDARTTVDSVVTAIFPRLTEFDWGDPLDRSAHRGIMFFGGISGFERRLSEHRLPFVPASQVVRGKDPHEANPDT
jgi:hypothetical protein